MKPSETPSHSTWESAQTFGVSVVVILRQIFNWIIGIIAGLAHFTHIYAVLGQIL